MIAPFDPNDIRVRVAVVIRGPEANHRFAFALDTGSNRTTLRPHLMRMLGFDLTKPVQIDRFRSVTGGGKAGAFVAPLVSALGVTHTDFILHAQELSTGLTIDGLLGLDFLRGRVLTLDFARGRIDLCPPGPWWAF